MALVDLETLEGPSRRPGWAEQPDPGLSGLDPKPRAAQSVLGARSPARGEAQLRGNLLLLLETLPARISSPRPRVLSHPLSMCLEDTSCLLAAQKPHSSFPAFS